MNKKRIRQMNTLLLRRLQKRPAGDYFARQKEFLQGLERENYMQRFAPLLEGGRVQCAQVAELCRAELEQLCPQTPREGWLQCAFDYARGQLFPEQGGESAGAAGAAFGALGSGSMPTSRMALVGHSFTHLRHNLHFCGSM